MCPSFNEFAIKNFASFIAMTLIIDYSMKQTSSFFWLLQCFHWFYCVWCSL